MGTTLSAYGRQLVRTSSGFCRNLGGTFGRNLVRHTVDTKLAPSCSHHVGVFLAPSLHVAAEILWASCGRLVGTLWSIARAPCGSLRGHFMRCRASRPPSPPSRMTRYSGVLPCLKQQLPVLDTGLLFFCEKQACPRRGGSSPPPFAPGVPNYAILLHERFRDRPRSLHPLPPVIASRDVLRSARFALFDAQ